MILHLTKNFLNVLLLLHQSFAVNTGYDEEYKCRISSCDGDRLSQPCGCDDLCEIYGDCCADYTRVGGERQTGQTKPTTDNVPTLKGDSQSDTVTDLDAEQDLDKSDIPRNSGDTSDVLPSTDRSLIRCLYQPFNDDSARHYLVSRCPTDWNDDHVRDMCESDWPGNLPEYLFPVKSNLNRLSYKNTFCAVCNNQQLRDLHFWAYEYNCHRHRVPEVPEDFYTKVSRCKVVFHEPSRRRCVKSVERCPVDTTATARVVSYCDRYTDLVRGRSRVHFSNIYCAMCNGLSMGNITCDSYKYMFNDQEGSKTPSMSALAKFYSKSDLNTRNWTLEIKATCRDGYMFVRHQCERARCPKNFLLEHAKQGCVFQKYALDVAVCSAEGSNPTERYTSIKDKTYPTILGACRDSSEGRHVVSFNFDWKASNVDRFLSRISEIIYKTTFDYRKFVFATSNQMTEEIRTRFSRNCTNLTKNGSAQLNLDSAYKFVKKYVKSASTPLVNITSERMERSGDYRLNVEVCDMEAMCEAVRVDVDDMTLEDAQYFGDKIQTTWFPNHYKFVVCAEEMNKLEDMKREGRNQKLIEFYRKQIGFKKNDALRMYGIEVVNNIVLVVMASLSI